MKFKKFLVILVSLLCFFGLGLTLSKQQSQRADQILTNNGLSSPYYVFNPNKKMSIRTFLKHLDKKHSNEQLQVHFKSKYDNGRILIWSNYNLKSQPMAKGSSRYFNKSDFQGAIPFAVVSPKTKTELAVFQGNRYIQEGTHYYSVIGELKQNNENPNGQTAYYLTTGIEQNTSRENIKNFNVVIDGLNRNDASSIRKYLHANMQAVDYSSTYNKNHHISPTKKFMLAVFCVVVALIDAIVWAILDSVPLKRARFKNLIVSKLLRNSYLRFIVTDFFMLLIVYLAMPVHFFYSNRGQLFNLLIFVYLMQVVTFFFTTWFVRLRKGEKNGTTR